jgi:hypothetical protein
VSPESSKEKENVGNQPSADKQNIEPSMYATSADEIAPEKVVKPDTKVVEGVTLYALSSADVSGIEQTSYDTQAVSYAVSNHFDNNLYLAKEDLEDIGKGEHQGIQSLQDSLYIAADEANEQVSGTQKPLKTMETHGIRNWNNEFIVFRDETNKVGSCDAVFNIDWHYASSVSHQVDDINSL